MHLCKIIKSGRRSANCKTQEAKRRVDEGECQVKATLYDLCITYDSARNVVTKSELFPAKEGTRWKAGNHPRTADSRAKGRNGEVFCGEIQSANRNHLAEASACTILWFSREQLAAIADKLQNQGSSGVDPFLEGAKIEHEQFGDRIISESERQVCLCLHLIFKRNLLLEEAEEAGNGPKDIALFCASVCFRAAVECSLPKSVFRTWTATSWGRIFACGPSSPLWCVVSCSWGLLNCRHVFYCIVMEL